MMSSDQVTTQTPLNAAHTYINVGGCVCCCFFMFFNVFTCVSVRADGFRKVMHIDTGIVKQEKDGPVEFQHPYFKHGQDNLLENIKRKVGSSLCHQKI